MATAQEAICLVVDFAQSDLGERWGAAVAAQQFMLQPSFVGADEALPMLETGSVVAMVMFAREDSDALQTLLRAYQNNVGAIGDFQAIVCDEPDPAFMASVYEFGIERFFPAQTWAEDAAALSRDVADALADENSPEAKAIALTRSIRRADQAAITKAQETLGELATYDFRAAFAKGKALEATGNYEGAAEAYRVSRGLNKMFRPSAASLSENLMITGRVDEAIGLLEQLDRSNPRCVDRKASLVAGYVEKGDFAKAQSYLDAAAKLAPDHSRVREAKAQLLLATGKVGEAFQLMDTMSEVGPFFAAKLNEMGIKLSQAGKGKSALALYQKAHKIVRPELRYKITINAALACRRLGDFDMALKYVARCEREYGAMFPKLEKIRQALIIERKQAGANEAPAAPSQPTDKKAG